MSAAFDQAVAFLEDVHRRAGIGDDTVEEITAILEVRDQVVARYQPVFALERIPTLGEEDFREFLMFRNNRHWHAAKRLGHGVTVAEKHYAGLIKNLPKAVTLEGVMGIEGLVQKVVGSAADREPGQPRSSAGA